MTTENQTWANNQGAIVERPRDVRDYPLLERIYERHDRLIGRYCAGRTLEVAYGRHPHPRADVGVEAFPENNRAADGIEAVTGDVRDLPFADGSFETIVGRRFLHHVPAPDRRDVLLEMRRVLDPDGTLVLLEGTPGLYRRLTKGAAFRLGLLGEDNDEYGHLSADDVTDLVTDGGFGILEAKPLGSPVMPLSAVRSEWTRRLIGLYERSQVVRWWTFVVAKPDQSSRTADRTGGRPATVPRAR